MPKTKTQTPGEVLQKYIDDYQTNPFALSKSLGVNYQTVTHIISGKARITPQMAIRLSKYFPTTTTFWLDLQAQSEISALQSDKKFITQINKIPKAKLASKQPTGKKSKEPKTASKKRKRTTINPAVPKKAAKVKSRQKVKKFKTSKVKK